MAVLSSHNSDYHRSLLNGLYWSVEHEYGGASPDYRIQIYFPSSFEASLSTDSVPYSNDTFSSFGSLEIAACMAALERISEVSDIEFVVVDEPVRSLPNISVGSIELGDSVVGQAWGAGIPASYSNSDFHSNVWLDLSLVGEGFSGNADQFNHVMIHELLHSLGFKHPWDEVSSWSDPSSTRDLTDQSTAYTVLAYNDPILPVDLDGDGLRSDRVYISNLGLFDVLALQRVYGPNISHNNTDTFYRFSPDASDSYRVVALTNGNIESMRSSIFHTVWDAGGIDTFSFMDFDTDVEIDIRPGCYSRSFDLDSLGGSFVGNIGVSYETGLEIDCLIENVVAGKGNDRVFGNRAENEIWAGRGDDFVSSSSGDDALSGGEGNDVLFGGAGVDVLRGGKGDDVLIPGRSGDSIFFGRNSGFDTIRGFSESGGVSDDRLFLVGFSSKSISDIDFTVSRSDLIVKCSQNCSFVLKSYLTAHAIEEIFDNIFFV